MWTSQVKGAKGLVASFHTSSRAQDSTTHALSHRLHDAFTTSHRSYTRLVLSCLYFRMMMPTPTSAWGQPMQPPAYNAVQPRTTLQPTPASTSMSPVTSKPKKVEWPPAVRDYVRRAFDPESAIAGVSSQEMQTKLKETISYYAERNMQDSIDWTTYPLPQELIQEERRKAALMFPTSNGFANGLSSLHLNGVNAHTNPSLSTLKKRKSQDSDELAQETQATLPPWRRTNLESRMTFEAPNEKRQKKNAASDTSSKLDQAELEKRRQRFNLEKAGNNKTPPWGASAKDEDEMPTGPVVGTNLALEKSYFRLTAPPKAETVRPLHVLEKTLAMLIKKWRAEKNYNYICNQFKSLRQDLTVQHIKNAFTVKVYETHARISLEKGDTGEYNQCQTQLKALYALNLGGNPAEFKAYRILYFVYTCNKTDMNDMLAELTPADKSHPWIKHALNVRSALALSNYHKFFRLYLEAQNLGGYLMDLFIERERLAALANMSRAYISITLRFLTDELAFDNDEACREFLKLHGAQNIVEEKFDEKTGRQYRVKIREAALQFEQLRAGAFSKVDIKGQI
ncbi:THP3-like protein [Stagonosporopsis vannaccii]|nr:THP3-like protein [Stagonosporopsis vannaccii]